MLLSVSSMALPPPTGRTTSLPIARSRPAPYAIGGGVRPAHIHVIVSADGRPSLVTELVFEGDPHLASDPVGCR